MNSKRVFYGMIAGLAILLIATVGCTYLASSMLDKKAKTLTDLKVNDAVLDQELAGLAKARRDTQKYTPLQEIARSIVPQDKDQAQTIREIVKLAAESGITPSSITLPTSTLGAKSTTVPAGGAAASSKPGLTQLIPVKGSPGLYALQVTVTQDPQNPVPYSKFIDFLSRLEQNRRTALVSSIVLLPAAQDHTKLSFTLTLNEYIKP